MAIEFECPACGGVLHVADDYVGRTIRCGGCLAALVVPDGPPAPARRANRNEPPPEQPGTDERPRRRKPRPELLDEPPEQKGRGVFFWLVVVGAIVLLAVAGCCGGFWMVLPKADWHKHDSANGRFRAEFPAPIQPGVAGALKVDLNADARDEGCVLVRNLKVFVVVYRDVPEKDRKPGPATLDKLATEAKNWLEAPGVQGATDLQVSGFPARDFAVRSETKGYYLVRVVAAGDRTYTLFAGGALAKPNDADATRFRNSFEVLPKPKDE